MRLVIFKVSGEISKYKSLFLFFFFINFTKVKQTPLIEIEVPISFFFTGNLQLNI